MGDCPRGFRYYRCQVAHHLGWRHGCPTADGGEHRDCMCKVAAFERVPNDLGVDPGRDCAFAYQLQLMAIDARSSDADGNLNLMEELDRMDRMVRANPR